MIAAIYARKSTDQEDGDMKSVPGQVENARAFAATQGWAVEDAYIFTDDGVSGAEFERRPGFVALMDALRPSAPFQALILSEESRLGRSTNEVPYAIGRLVKAGVEVWCARDRRKVALGTPMDKFMVSASSFSSDMERWLAQQRTAESHLRRAKLGHVTGGKVFGYDNLRANGHVDRQVNMAEAAVVRDIYERYADGEGFKLIAHALNKQGVPAPRPQRGRPAGWEPSTVRAVLRRPLYRGTIVYNQTKKRDTDGRRHRGRQPKRPEHEWVTIDQPALRVVDLDLASEVDTRMARRRHAYLRTTNGRLVGRPVEGRHLLSGFLVCGCGAHFEAVKDTYICSARRRKGPSVCASEMVFPVEAIEQTFLDSIEHDVLEDAFIESVLASAFIVPPDVERAALVEERARLAREIENLTAAIVAGGDIPALATALQERDRRLKVLDAKLAKPIVMPDRDALRAALALRQGQWREVLRSKHAAQARQVLQHLIDLPIRIMNDPAPKWMARTRPGGLLVGLVQRGGVPSGKRCGRDRAFPLVSGGLTMRSGRSTLVET